MTPGGDERPGRGGSETDRGVCYSPAATRRREISPLTKDETAPTEELPTTRRRTSRARRSPDTQSAPDERRKRKVDRSRRSTAEPATHRSHATLRHRRNATVIHPKPLTRRLQTSLPDPLPVTDRELDALEILLGAEQDQ